jgi:hypothetical protein
MIGWLVLCGAAFGCVLFAVCARAAWSWLWDLDQSRARRRAFDLRIEECRKWPKPAEYWRRMEPWER